MHLVRTYFVFEINSKMATANVNSMLYMTDWKYTVVWNCVSVEVSSERVWLRREPRAMTFSLMTVAVYMQLHRMRTGYMQQDRG